MFNIQTGKRLTIAVGCLQGVEKCGEVWREHRTQIHLVTGKEIRDAPADNKSNSLKPRSHLWDKHNTSEIGRFQA